jgi:hypothetical protein
MRRMWHRIRSNLQTLPKIRQQKMGRLFLQEMLRRKAEGNAEKELWSRLSHTEQKSIV